jgi:hypothetical protein
MFQSFDWSTSTMVEDLSGEHPSSLLAWDKGRLVLDDGATHFGYVHSGTIQLDSDTGQFTVTAGMYFCVSDRGTWRSRNRVHSTSVPRSFSDWWPGRRYRTAAIY